MASKRREFYIYHLVDPRNGRIFYVGKGQGDRIHDHEREARRGVYSRKCSLIRDIEAAGQSVEKRIVARFAEEFHAFAAEKAAIAAIGLETLTNVLPGGICFPVERAQEPFKWRVDHITDLAPRIARALYLIATTGGLMVCGVDMTKDMLELFRRMARDVGWNEFSGIMRSQGLKLRAA